MHTFLSLSLLLFALTAQAENWFKDPAKKLCKHVQYKVQCTPCADGWYSAVYKDHLTGSTFGERGGTSCGKGNDCGDNFSIDEKSMKCETFVRALQKQQKSCKNCLQEDFSAGG
jgi:hypothetical protein